MVEPNTISYSATISTCEKGNDPTGSSQLSGVLSPALGVHLEPHPCSLVDAAMLRRRHEKGKRWELAMELLNECKIWATVDTISYNSAISACQKCSQWQSALALLQTM